MIKFIKRLLCSHYWMEGRADFTFKHGDYQRSAAFCSDTMIPHHCIHCGKVKLFGELNPPINFIGGEK